VEQAAFAQRLKCHVVLPGTLSAFRPGGPDDMAEQDRYRVGAARGNGGQGNASA
jgi:hypothetical protein